MTGLVGSEIRCYAVFRTGFAMGWTATASPPAVLTSVVPVDPTAEFVRHIANANLSMRTTQATTCTNYVGGLAQRTVRFITKTGEVETIGEISLPDPLPQLPGSSKENEGTNTNGAKSCRTRTNAIQPQQRHCRYMMRQIFESD